MKRRPPRFLAALLLAGLPVVAGCDDDPVEPGGERPFYQGAEEDPRIGLVVNSLDNTLGLFHVADPSEAREVALGASSAVTATGIAVGSRRIAVPLGNAASVALIDPETLRIERFFLFPSGNATGAVFTGDGALLVANLVDDQVGRVTLDQAGNTIDQVVPVAPAPTDVEVVAGRALVVSGNLDESFAPLGPSVVTALDPTTLEVLGTVETGGENASAAAVGPDGLLYVVNTGNFVSSATLAIIDPLTLERIDLIEGAGVGAGAITVDEEGLAYISGFFLGTLVFDTATRSWMRGADDPVCAPLEGGGCRGAFDAVATAEGRLYQSFFGSPGEGLAPWIFVYEPGNWTLTDSIATGLGPAATRIAVFEP